ncbi:hypothetical protein [Cryobacterium sp. GrIS_2_6]|uniref:hypothetical protein n=1 Tax=Cryobacterium sp. GrIS_2_6 TaxID=3162785 RepID=UPI002E0977E1|nr:hypothetical protein [Cryobacterium psychrotolerans]MEC5149310.1 hypothetical protein [Cryobacterium psychrotolerans]
MNLDSVSRDTLVQLYKAQSSGVTTATGLTGVDLTGWISQIPVNTPFLDSLARSTPEVAGPAALWRVLTNVNNLQSDPGTAFDAPAPMAILNMINASSQYAKLGYGYTVTQDAIDLAKGFADARTIAVINAMNQWKIGSDKKLLGGQNFALPTPAVPTTATAATGGTVAAATYLIKVAARTGSNYSYGGSTIASAQGSQITTGATSTLTATVASIPGAVAYDWFVGGFYITTTTVNTVTFLTTPAGSNQPVPNLPGIYGVAPTSVPVADSSAKATDFNGLLATLAGDYVTGGATGLVTRGSGINSGAGFTSLGGSTFTSSGQSINELDALNTRIFNTVQLSPTRYLVSAQESNSISKLLLANGAANTFFTPGAEGRTDVTGGGYVTHYVNKAAGGVPVRIEVHPNLTPGTLIAVSDTVPFPNSNISNVLEVRSLHDVADYEYATNRGTGVGGGPRFDGEVFSTSTLINRAPVACAVVQDIAAN